MSSELGDNKGVDDISESKPKEEAEPLLVGCRDVATARNESEREEADDKSTSTTSESVNIVEKRLKSGEDGKDEVEVADEDSSEQVKDSEKNKEEDIEETQTDSNSRSDSISDFDVYFSPDEISDVDSGSEKELNALESDMGQFGSKKSKHSNGKRARAPYEDPSSDEYDEKWDRPWQPKEKRAKKTKPYSYPKRWSERDTEDYRNGYPGKRDNKSQTLNLDFYCNKIPSRPDGDYIDNIHKEWYGDHHKLEIHHGYIQWLFPIRESGMNFHARELQLHEARDICDDPVAHKRVLKSYKMMLDFYGIRLIDDETGKLERAENWKERFTHLNRSMHNYLRITRILKSLGELGYERLKAPFVRFVMVEALKKKTLEKTVNSCCSYWLETIKDDKEREELKKYADELLSCD